MPFIHAIDPTWARARLFPKFTFDQAGDEAFLLWEPHLKYGRLSRDLIIEMLPLYPAGFPASVISRTTSPSDFTGTSPFVIIYSCLVTSTRTGG